MRRVVQFHGFVQRGVAELGKPQAGVAMLQAAEWQQGVRLGEPQRRVERNRVRFAVDADFECERPDGGRRVGRDVDPMLLGLAGNGHRRLTVHDDVVVGFANRQGNWNVALVARLNGVQAQQQVDFAVGKVPFVRESVGLHDGGLCSEVDFRAVVDGRRCVAEREFDVMLLGRRLDLFQWHAYLPGTCGAGRQFDDRLPQRLILRVHEGQWGAKLLNSLNGRRVDGQFDLRLSFDPNHARLDGGGRRRAPRPKDRYAAAQAQHAAPYGNARRPAGSPNRKRRGSAVWDSAVWRHGFFRAIFHGFASTGAGGGTGANSVKLPPVTCHGALT